MTERELATVLAALRERQRRLIQQDRVSREEALKYQEPDLDEIATNGDKFDALSIEEIDELCERLNAHGSEPPSERAVEYRVSWKIDLDADSPEQAARAALRIQRDPTSIATVFEVTPRAGGKTVTVDLGEGPDGEASG